MHLCHGLSYPISGLNKTYKHPGYAVDHAIVVSTFGKGGEDDRLLTFFVVVKPHGVSVALTAPSVFRFTAASCPDRHIDAASAFGADPANIKESMAGDVLAEKLTRFLEDLGVPNGLGALGYDSSYIPSLVEGALPQHRVTKLAPAGEPAAEQIASIFEKSMSNY